MNSPRTHHRGAILLEVILALSIFVTSGLAILTLVTQSTSRLTAIRDNETAADLARSAMAQIEAGLATPESLLGPVPDWLETESGQAMVESELMRGAAGGGSGGLDMNVGTSEGPAGAPASGLQGEVDDWVLEVESNPSQFEGLTTVTVTAVRGDGADAGVVRYSLTQLVRLSSDEADSVGQFDPLVDEAMQQQPRSSP